jgi:hypothetical protein
LSSLCDAFKRNPSRSTEAFERSELRLDRDALCSCSFDNEPAVQLNCCGCNLGRRAVLAINPGYCGRPKPVGVWIQSKDDLRATSLNGCSKSIPEGDDGSGIG